MQERLEESQSRIYIDNYLHHYWLSKWDYVSKKRLYRFAKKRIKAANARETLDSILEDSELYRALHEPTYQKWKNNETRIRRSLTALNIFGVPPDQGRVALAS